MRDADRSMGNSDPSNWQWGRTHAFNFRHILNVPEWSLGTIARAGDEYTVNAAGLVNGKPASVPRGGRLSTWLTGTVR